ncbi:MAG: histidine ammonia-lyase [Synergistaceae bacterium]|nr:histidine ammonia-lyase [Synergistota bacterium]NLM72193.1 histidine ammonia-lyase [Synergistaceae bacterium]
MNGANDGVLHLDGLSLTLEDVVRVARGEMKVELEDEAARKVEAASAVVRRWENSDEVVYGVTTGFGDLANVNISRKDRRLLQENLLKSHACGVGAPFPEDITRAMMLLRINSLIRGFSGISLSTLNQYVAFLNLGITPVVPSQGSVGASGDLCPLSHLALPLLGHGKVRYKGRVVTAAKALQSAGLRPVQLGAKEGIALNNGTACMGAMGVMALTAAEDLAKTADIAAALSIEALHGVPYAFDERTHALRAHRGQGRVAQNIRRLIKGSEIIEKYRRGRVQDAYSLRCAPQVHGASRDALDYVRSTLEVEINSVTDNPLIFTDVEEAISGGNFHGQPLALAMDFFGIAVAELANISERRQARLVDSSLSGLPPFLVEESGLNSGFMIAQYTSAALVSENKVLAHPSSVDSIPTSANQEDHVSMGAYSARKALSILDNARKVIAIELFTASQGLDFSRLLKPGAGTVAAHESVRSAVPFLKHDEYLHPLIERVEALVRRGAVVKAVEEAIGPLN